MNAALQPQQVNPLKALHTTPALQPMTSEPPVAPLDEWYNSLSLTRPPVYHVRDPINQSTTPDSIILLPLNVTCTRVKAYHSPGNAQVASSAFLGASLVTSLAGSVSLQPMLPDLMSGGLLSSPAG